MVVLCQIKIVTFFIYRRLCDLVRKTHNLYFTRGSGHIKNALFGFVYIAIVRTPKSALFI